MPQLQAYLSKNGRQEFLDALAANGIEFTMRQHPPGRISASLDAIVIQLGGPLIGAMAGVLINWQRTRASRSVIIQRKNEVIQIKGYSVDDVERFLNGASSTTLIDAKKDDA